MAALVRSPHRNDELTLDGEDLDTLRRTGFIRFPGLTVIYGRRKRRDWSQGPPLWVFLVAGACFAAIILAVLRFVG